MAYYKRMIQLNTNLGIRLSKLRSINAVSTVDRLQLSCGSVNSYRSLSSNSSQLVKPNEKRVFLVNTLALVKRLEAQGIPSKHAEEITSAMTLVLGDSWKNMCQNLVSKDDMQKVEMAQEANLSNFKHEVQSSKEHHFALLQREAEKLRDDIQKLRGEFRYEIDKATAGQRLDLNLERRRIRDELTNQSAETANLTNKLDREIHELRAQLEAAKFDVIKYCIGTLVSISAVGMGFIRIFISKH